MSADADGIGSLQRLLEQLREEAYSSGEGAAYERLVAQYRAAGAWPFAD